MFTTRNNKAYLRSSLIAFLALILLAACQVSTSSVTSAQTEPPPTIIITSTPDSTKEMEPDEGKKVVLDDPGIRFDLAQRATDFELLFPAYFPETFEFLGVSLMSRHEAALNFLQSEPTKQLVVLVQTVMGSDSQFNVVMETQNVQTVVVNETEAIWIYDPNGDEGFLDWRINDIRYRLVGITDLTEALMIAESLE